MVSKVFNSRAQVWDYAQSFSHDGQAWVEITGATDFDGLAYRSIFSPEGYLGAGTILQR